MKLLPVKKRKIAVLFSGGLGDTIMVVPLLKELKRKQFHITCVFFAAHPNDCIFDNSLFDKKVFIKSRLHFLWYAVFAYKRFANFYINHMGAGMFVKQCISLATKRITQNIYYNRATKRDKVIINSFTDPEQNLNLLYSKYNSLIKDMTSIYIAGPVIKSDVYAGQYYIVQLSSGNNKTPFKNWPFKNWLVIIRQLCESKPDIDFIIPGDRFELQYIEELDKLQLKNCKVLIGKTTVEEIVAVIAGSNGYIGQDSGLMQIAAALQKRTFSIFGATDEKLVGYQHIDPANHKIITVNISCRPCASLKGFNTTRVTNPLHCPDFACLTSISPTLVWEAINTHFKFQ
jgi:ADP-heptose:LPS heptosyltransferase